MRTKADMLPHADPPMRDFFAEPLWSPTSVNRICQENAGAEQSHKRGGQFKP
jgi:hypothetical protein